MDIKYKGVVMDFSYKGFVNRLLMQVRQKVITNFNAVALGDDAYKCQLAVNDTIADMSHLLKIKKRLTTFEITTIAAQRTYNVPKRVIYPFYTLRQTSSGQKITQMTTSDFDRLVPDDDSSGDPSQYYLDGYSAVLNQPASAGEVVYVVSNSSSDNTEVVIQGYDTNDNFVSEEITLSGTVATASSHTYKRIENISKIVTYGTITFRNSGSTTTYLTLAPKEVNYRGMVIGLHPIPSGAITIYGRGWLRVPSMVNEYDVPIGFTENHLNAINFGALWRYRMYSPDIPPESLAASKQNYIDEILKIIGEDAKDPDIIHRMRSPYEVRGNISVVRALDRRYP